MFRIPSFDDFLAEMGEEGYNRWIGEIDGMQLAASMGNPVDWIQNYSVNLLRASHELSVAMLRDYHEWLVDKLSSTSIHLVK